MIPATEIFGEQIFEEHQPMHEHANDALIENRLRLNVAALWGPAGEFVNTIFPHTKANPAALLTSFLVGFGSIIGRNAFYAVDGAKHFGNLFLALAGASSKGRKGTAWNRTKQVLQRIDPAWAMHGICTGLSSGEGLIQAAVNSVEDLKDSRLTVIQTEFASTMAVMSRQGNTLSGTIREAWDSGHLQTMIR